MHFHLCNALILFVIYETLAIVYYAYRRTHFLRRNSIFVFSSNGKMNNALSRRHSFYALRNSSVAKCRRSNNNALHFSLIATREFDNDRLEFVLAIDATVDYLDSAVLASDPKARAIDEIGSAVTRYVADCNEPYFYLLFGNNNGCMQYVNTECRHARLHALRISIDDVVIRQSAQNLTDDAVSTTPAV